MTKLAQTTCPECGLVMYGLRLDKDSWGGVREIINGCPRCKRIGLFIIKPTVESRPLGGPDVYYRIKEL